MSITAERKQALIKEYATKAGDTGSPEVQVAILTRAHQQSDRASARRTRRISIRGAAC